MPSLFERRLHTVLTSCGRKVRSHKDFTNTTAWRTVSYPPHSLCASPAPMRNRGLDSRARAARNTDCTAGRAGHARGVVRMAVYANQGGWMVSTDAHGLEAARCLHERLGALTGGAAERRHEQLMEWSESELELDRGYAEQIYRLAEEEQLEPVHALLLVHCGVGVLELDPPERDDDEEAVQQVPPEWIGRARVSLDDVVLERRLRSTFRRFRGQLQNCADAQAAAAAYLAEPDVGPVLLQ